MAKDATAAKAVPSKASDGTPGTSASTPANGGEPSGEEVHRATQNSLRTAPGAYSVPGAGGGAPAPASTTPDYPASSSGNRHGSGNTVGALEIIAEATPVPDGASGSAREGADGEYDDVSAVTSPTAIGTHVASEGTAGETSVTSIGGGAPPSQQAAASASPPDEENIVEATPVKEGRCLSFLETRRGCFVATAMVVLVAGLVIGLSVGLTANQNNNNSNNDGGDGEPVDETNEASDGTGETPTPPTDSSSLPGYVTTATANFCNAAIPIMPEGYDGTEESIAAFAQTYPSPEALDFPFQFFGNWERHCGEEEIATSQGGVQQALVNALCRDDATNNGEEGDGIAVDVCLENAGATRSELARGPVTRDALEAMHPFNNNLVHLQVTGAQLGQIVSNAVEQAAAVDDADESWLWGSEYPYAHGMRFEVDVTKPEGAKVVNAEVYDGAAGEWTLLEDNLVTTYWVQTNDYVASGGDGYMVGVTPLNMTTTGVKMVDAIVASLSELEEWDPPTIEERSTVSFVNGLRSQG